jgi:hypothetical protein
MGREISLESAPRVVVVAWRSGEDGLWLRLRGDADDVLLRCVCNRSHFIVREPFDHEGTYLFVSCHSCGRSGRYAFGPARATEARTPRP